MRTALIIAVIVLVAVTAGTIVWQTAAEPGPERPIATEKEGVDIARERERWRDRIAAAGPAAAYTEFKSAYADRHFSDQHIAVHLMGALLFETIGTDALAVCDATFAFGCYHSFFASAIGKSGVEIIDDLDRKCRERLGPGETGCQHGIGHGLMEYLGAPRLEEALTLCRRATTIHPLLGCTAGVFMEYNTPIVIGATADQTVRPFEQDQPYAPCPSLPREFRTSCYFELAPSWWKTYLDFGAMGRLCAELGVEHEREACFQGIGYTIVPFNDYVLPASIADCGRMPTEEGELLCRAGMWWSYFVVPERRAEADGACGDLTPPERTSCIQKGRPIR